jgi:hypothetical protein
VSELVTVAATVPDAWAEVVQVMLVELTTVTELHAEPLSETDAPDKKPVPVIMMFVPPPSEPLDGEIDVTVGAAS